MITLSIAPAILFGEVIHGWTLKRKLIALASVLALDSVYVIPYLI